MCLSRRLSPAIPNQSSTASASEYADRTYAYDNSVDNAEAAILFRLTDGRLAKQYVEAIPSWAETIL